MRSTTVQLKDEAKTAAQAAADYEEKKSKKGKKDKEDKTLMKPFDTLSDDEVKALVAYVRSFKQ